MSDARQIDVEAVGDAIASALDGRVDASTRLAGRERLIRASEAPPRRGWIAPAALAFTFAAVAALWVGFLRQRAEDETVAPSAAIATTEWVQAPARGTVALQVGEGAALALHDGARGRVSIADATQVGVVLEAGTLRADVDPQARRRVVVEAGPHRVHVVGTVFEVQWSPSDGVFGVEVTRGKVEVHTPASSAPIAVDAGRRLVATPTGDVKLSAIEHVDEAEPVIEIDTDAATPSEDPDEPVAPRVREKPTRPAAEPVVSPSWESLAKAGKYADAYAAIEAAGFDGALGSLPVASLEQLADVARLAGKSTKAELAYTRLRTRFAGTAAAARAAFQLGRIAADTSRKPKDAVRWLETYLAEAPQGSFAKLARGRLVVALRDAGDRQAARAAARVYLDSYPDGPHAKIADALLASP